MCRARLQQIQEVRLGIIRLKPLTVLLEGSLQTTKSPSYRIRGHTGVMPEQPPCWYTFVFEHYAVKLSQEVIIL